MSQQLAISEIFLSIQGESTRAGLPCALVRLAGCNLNCTWCDTSYARDSAAGTPMSIIDVMARVKELGCRRVEVTGGEPLIQNACLNLLENLCNAGYQTLLETNGSRDISLVDPRVIRIVDFKCPSSGESSANLWSNVAHLSDNDEVKFVLADPADYEFARSAIDQHGLIDRCGAVILSPVAGRLAPNELAGWILADGLNVRLGLQLHKIIWPDRTRGV